MIFYFKSDAKLQLFLYICGIKIVFKFIGKGGNCIMKFILKRIGTLIITLVIVPVPNNMSL